MKIELECCCGAKAKFMDPEYKLIDRQNGTADEKGRLYIIEVKADEWLDRHQACRPSLVMLNRKPVRADQ